MSQLYFCSFLCLSLSHTHTHTRVKKKSCWKTRIFMPLLYKKLRAKNLHLPSHLCVTFLGFDVIQQNDSSYLIKQISGLAPAVGHAISSCESKKGCQRLSVWLSDWLWGGVVFRTLLSSCLFDELLHKCWSDWNNNCHAESMPKLSKMGQIYWKAIWCSYSCAVPFPKTQRVFQTS